MEFSAAVGAAKSIFRTGIELCNPLKKRRFKCPSVENGHYTVYHLTARGGVAAGRSQQLSCSVIAKNPDFT